LLSTLSIVLDCPPALHFERSVRMVRTEFSRALAVIGSRHLHRVAVPAAYVLLLRSR
jgi:hypothetical protein